MDIELQIKNLSIDLGLVSKIQSIGWSLIGRIQSSATPESNENKSKHFYPKKEKKKKK